MKKIKPEVWIAAGVVIIIALFIGVSAYHNQQQAQQQKQRKQLSAKQIRAQKAKLDKLALPQLQDGVAENESEVRIETTAGAITVKLFNQEAPLAVKNFITHAQDGYYDGTAFHRVVKDFMIQGGDPKGTGAGGHSIWYQKDQKLDSGNGFKNEISPKLYNIRGALAMANAGPDTNGSQFFIDQNHDDQMKKIDRNQYPEKIYKAYRKGGNPSLDGKYTVFGQVMDGMSVVDQIAAGKVEMSESNEKSKPVNPVKIKTVTVLKTAK
ncbi:peptidylprolyl isomerase [Weissella viridescens]|uniref:Peptidyl-prolyl cis-trans isomerase n=1 Tax=Weissella viridescens TaxID=1629 RepID=A0A3P2RFF2_WEIVI|nr:peptidylprolyl isomerase [Weissella viridescens]RRG17530.1 peptidylprolyl isomerase [Weissella viridescens]